VATKPVGSKRAASNGIDALVAYNDKRDFAKTAEPKGKLQKGEGDGFCVQKHDATRLHYDLRLELDGVLKSWAVTRGPSLVPGEKRVSVHTEDHPMEYLTFEGVIPKDEYGGGTMIVWDRGRWQPDGDSWKAYAKGHLDFTLEGERLKGRWHLVRMRPRPREKKEQWLLIKGDDEHARTADEPEIVAELTTSILSGRTNDELAASGAVRDDHAARANVTAKRSVPPPSASKIKGAKKGILPPFVEPELATLGQTAPSGDEWVHEIKFDGFRLQARIDGGKVQLLTRKGLDWTDKFPRTAEALKGLKLGSALIDGEVVVEDESGASSFTALQEALKTGQPGRMTFYAFDLLYLGGYDLRNVPLIERKTLLAGCLDDAPAGGPIRYSEHIERDGEAMLRNACRLGLEGIISKRKDQPYRSGRARDWFKTKCTERQELVIAGYVPSTTSAKMVGSLVMGVHEGGQFLHVGRVGTGFTDPVARSLRDELERIKRPTSPFPGKLTSGAIRGVRWAEPKLVAEVELRGWTSDGLLRHASFKGLRDDKDAAEVVRESRVTSAGPPASKHDFALTHPDRVLWPDVGVTKEGLAEFYAEIADWVLPHLVDRPLSLVRCPSGAASKCFFQKHAWEGIGKAIKRKDIGDDEVLFIKDLDGLIALVQASVLEIHPWGSKLRNVEAPDRVTFDLDPGEDVAWTALIEAASEVRERLHSMKLESFLKTTGGKGLHVVVPLTAKAEWEAVKSFAQEVADGMAKDSPSRYTAVLSKSARGRKIFIDYLRNGRGATAVAAYSTRARAGATISTPLAWDELSPAIRPGHFTVDNLPTRLRHLGSDPWAEIDNIRQVLPRIRAKRRG
jgi:bifunctional non-homologous end joining protein LigD